jgi:hypothetical protein
MSNPNDSGIPYRPIGTQPQPTTAVAGEEAAMAVVLDALGLDAPPERKAIVPIVSRRRRPAPVLPPVTQVAIELPKAEKAYKVPFALTEGGGWNLSFDGGKNNEPTGSTAISGAPVDLALAITPANWQKGSYDWRLSLEFVDEDGAHCEINLNALRPSKDDPSQLVLTGPARSLLGSLLAITDENNEQCDANMAAFINGACFRLKKGTAPKSQFIEVDICKVDAETGELVWENYSAPKYTARVINSPAGLIETVERIKHTLRLRNYLSPTPAVTGADQVEAQLKEGQDAFVVVPVESTVIND